jgi:hypothetical protein
MVSEPYYFEGKSYKYETGQGMGAYSSWASMALCHHLILVTAARLSNSQASYAMLGDDVVIAGRKFADRYRYLIDLLGVEISHAKSYYSKELYEFAKRQIYKGVEITGAPLHGLGTTIRRYHFFIEQLNQWENRIGLQSSMVTRGMILDLYKMTGRPTEFSERLADKSYGFYLLPRKEDKFWEGRAIDAVAFFLKNLLGCNRSALTCRKILVGMLTTVKSKMIEEGLVESAKNYNSFVMKLDSIAEQSGGAVSPTLLREIPPVRTFIDNIKDIQTEYEKVRSNIWHNRDEDVLFDRSLSLGLNPLAVFSLRPHENVMANNAWLLKKFKQWLPGQLEAREAVYEAHPDEIPSEEQITRLMGPSRYTKYAKTAGPYRSHRFHNPNGVMNR